MIVTADDNPYLRPFGAFFSLQISRKYILILKPFFMMKGEKQNMDLGKNYAGILAKIILEAKNSKKMKFEDVLDIAEKRAQLFAQEGFSIEKLPETVSKPLSAKYILEKGNETYQVTVARHVVGKKGISKIQVQEADNAFAQPIEEAGFELDNFWKPNYYKFYQRF